MGMAAVNPGWRLRGRRSWGSGQRANALTSAARRELLMRGTAGSATILGVRSASSPGFALPFGVGGDGDRDPDHLFWVRVAIDGAEPYETRVRQRVRDADLAAMQPGDVVCCRVDPGDRDRLVLYVPDADEAVRVSIAKILADGRRADATVLAATPVAADYTGRDDPVLRLDLELRAWDEPRPWRVRLTQPVPLAAIGLVDLGRRLEAAFFTVDRGESVAVDWAASLGEE
ncbi:hypothetical protein IU433_16525 [Nocardia puris]|uniref:Uncharacterized protein n=1 Tax=Nocardia puris TaxID=208602 RepID=A0A366DCA7_9NOCA|nr:hypothetical protein [Nocardia puris]MBF6211714.1 hypothetical protein [Nocardia puris]MBF6365718.1 hypothetical protein [Nocardia puris]MBF6460640.1 hypothetical protein [Nocardia puris]RBO86888.1 hypothetical protein DFR74_11260 [Nocardia puris]